MSLPTVYVCFQAKCNLLDRNCLKEHEQCSKIIFFFRCSRKEFFLEGALGKIFQVKYYSLAGWKHQRDSKGHKVSCIILVIKIFFCLRGGFTVRCPHRRPKYAIPERESYGNFALCRQLIMCARVAAKKPKNWGCDCGTTFRRLVSGCETLKTSNAQCTTIMTAGATIKNSFPWKNWFSFQKLCVEVLVNFQVNSQWP